MCKVFYFTAQWKGVVLAMKIEMVRLYDIYMPLLSERQSEILNLYYNEDQSLAEISENVGITRQGVRDCIVKAETQLEFFEEKLGLMQKLSDLSTAVDCVIGKAEALGADKSLTEELTALKNLI